MTWASKKNFYFARRKQQSQLAPTSLTLLTTSHNKKARWENCVSLCTDGAPAMLGARHGFTERVGKINPSVQVVHCLLHRENLAAQHLSLDLSAVMKEVVGVVNFIKASAVNSRLFVFSLFVDHRCLFQHLLFYSNVRWLSRGKLLRRLVDI